MPNVNVAEQRQIRWGNAAGNWTVQGRCRSTSFIRASPLLPTAARCPSIASAVVNRPANPRRDTSLGRVVQRPVAEQFHLNFTAAGLR